MDRFLRRSRAGFTLIEVLVAILIVGILMALLLPALNAAVRRSKEAAATAEMNNLATALADFKQKYGDYPPSRIVLCETGYYSQAFQNLGSTVVGPLSPSGNDTDISYQQLAQRSLLYLNRFWPRVDFNNGQFDFNNDSSISGTHVLSGSECLTFFLGGIPSSAGNGTFALTGFSKNPTNPFLNNILATNRTIPNYEFNLGRLVDQDNDGFPSYLDALNNAAAGSTQRSYAYFFSYGSNGYDPNDVNGYGRHYDPTTPSNDFEQDETGTGYAEWQFNVAFPPNIVTSPAPNPYTSSATLGATVSWINPNSFQILCCGVDGLWGVGGTYSQNTAGNVLPILATTPGNINGDINRIAERDNLTNFSGGRLD